MADLWQVNQSALRWLRSSGEERNAAFSDFAQKQHRMNQRLMKTPEQDIEARRVERELRNIIQEEIDRLPRNRQLTEAEMEQFIESVSSRSAERMESVMDDILRSTYMASLAEVAGDVGTNLNFTPRHQRAFETAMSERGLAETFDGFSDETAQAFREVIQEAYETGRVSPGRITTRLIDESTWRVRSRLERIAATETWKVWQEAREQGYQEAEELLGEEFLYEFGTVEDEKTCDMCQEIIDETRGGVPMDELKEVMLRIINRHSSDSWDPLRGDREIPLPHPNCVVAGTTQIRSEDGWTEIRRIEEGDKVLTHRGNWKPVTHVFEPRTYEGELTKLTARVGEHKAKTVLTLTAKHPVLVHQNEERFWKYAKDLHEDDKVYLLARDCENCGAPIPEGGRSSAKGRKTCSEECRTRLICEKRDTEEWREKLSESTTKQLNREYEDGTRDPQEITKAARAAAKEKYGPGMYFSTGEQTREGDGNPAKRKEVRQKISEALTGEGNGMFGKMGEENPAWKPFAEQSEERCAPKSARERVLERDEHKCQFCGKSNDESIEEYGFGLDMHHVTPYRYTKDHRPENLITACRTCHMWVEGINDVEYLESGGAQFAPFDVEIEREVRKADPDRRSLPTVWNIEVADDHSYVASGFVVQNCRHTFYRTVEVPD